LPYRLGRLKPKFQKYDPKPPNPRVKDFVEDKLKSKFGLLKVNRKSQLMLKIVKIKKNNQVFGNRSGATSIRLPSKSSRVVYP
jgi:hypothetical protein